MGLFRRNKKAQATQPKKPGMISRTVKGTYRTFLNVPGWFGYEFLKVQTVGLVQFVQYLFRHRYANRTENFQQAMLRLGLTESDIDRRYKEVRLLFYICFGLGILLAAYSLYLIFASEDLIAAVFSFVVTGLCLAKAFSYHFWMYQIKHRRLGCSVRQWLGLSPLEK